MHHLIRNFSLATMLGISTNAQAALQPFNIPLSSLQTYVPPQTPDQQADQMDPQAMIANVLAPDMLASYAPNTVVVSVELPENLDPDDVVMAALLRANIEQAAPGWVETYEFSNLLSIRNNPDLSAAEIEQNIASFNENKLYLYAAMLKQMQGDKSAALAVPHTYGDTLCLVNTTPVIANEPANYHALHVMADTMACDEIERPYMALIGDTQFQPKAISDMIWTAIEYGFSVADIEGYIAQANNYGADAGLGAFVGYYLHTQGVTDDAQMIRDTVDTVTNLQMQFGIMDEDEINKNLIGLFNAEPGTPSARWSYIQLIHRMKTQEAEKARQEDGIVIKSQDRLVPSP